MHIKASAAWVADYNIAVLRQGLDLLGSFANPMRRAAFAEAAGPHLRHVIEHYEALLDTDDEVDSGGASHKRIIDYDARRRDKRVETCPDVTRDRLEQLIAKLSGGESGPGASVSAGGNGLNLNTPLQIAQFGGLDGTHQIVAESSLGRELMFVASHAIHHYAVLKPMLLQLGCTLPADFGKAPATVRHERTLQSEPA